MGVYNPTMTMAAEHSIAQAKAAGIMTAIFFVALQKGLVVVVGRGVDFV
jgi:hypothetical protein